MAKVAKTYTELLNNFAQRAEEAIKVYTPEIEGIFNQVLQDEFQKNGSDTYIHRADGLLSGKNIESEITARGKSRGIFIWDETKPGKSIFNTALTSDGTTMFFEWINDGQWFDVYRWMNSGFPEDKENFYRTAIPLIDPIFNELRYNKIPQKLVNYIKTGKK